MRRVPGDIAERLNRRIQTRANGAEPELDLWITRPTTALTSDRFLERQTVKVGTAPITDIGVAAGHPKLGSDSDRVYAAYVQGGVAKVASAAVKARMDAHVWLDTGFAEPAGAVSIAFDGTMPKDTAGKIEFMTESLPWVFWVNAGALYARRLNGADTFTLAESNCTDVSAVRAMWSQVGDFDFGLVVFFLLSGALYYRQRIGGVWQDAIPVSYGPAGVVWAEIAAFRTWDFRVGVQAKAATGEVYELFTQYAGVAKQNTEHLEIAHVSAKGRATAIRYSDTAEGEHIELVNVASTALYGGLYSIDPPVLLSAANQDDGAGDWGKELVVTVDVHLERESIAASATAWTITDAAGAAFTASTAVVGPDGKTVVLTFADFNAASGACRAAYTPGAAVTMAGTAMTATEVGFVPQNLAPPLVGPPEPLEAWNIGEDGTCIAIRFTEPLTSDAASCPPEAFTVSAPMRDYAPDGAMTQTVRAVAAVERYDGVTVAVDLTSGAYTDTVIKKTGLTLADVEV